MVLNNVTLLHGTDPVNIFVKDGKIAGISDANPVQGISSITFTGTLALPGLINSHDHLDFNCFSVLGDSKYSNYTEWGQDIHKTYRKEIDLVLSIPHQLRISWGMYKNLIAGVTTVVNHGAILNIKNPLINIYQGTQNLHSVAFQKNWKWKLNNPFYKSKPCVIHTGEGCDKRSGDEIDALLRFNLLKRKLVGVHGVAMNTAQAKKFAGLAWCPESNEVLLGRHANIIALKRATNVVFGTDSTLTGNWNIWHHLRLARKQEQVSDGELYHMISAAPAKLWGMNNGELLPGKDADIIIVNQHNKGWDNLFENNPHDILFVMQQGKIRMFDESLFIQIKNLPVDLSAFSCIVINEAVKFVAGDLPELRKIVSKYTSDFTFPFEVRKTSQTSNNA